MNSLSNYLTDIAGLSHPSEALFYKFELQPDFSTSIPFLPDSHNLQWTDEEDITTYIPYLFNQKAENSDASSFNLGSILMLNLFSNVDAEFSASSTSIHDDHNNLTSACKSLESSSGNNTTIQEDPINSIGDQTNNSPSFFWTSEKKDSNNFSLLPRNAKTNTTIHLTNSINSTTQFATNYSRDLNSSSTLTSKYLLNDLSHLSSNLPHVNDSLHSGINDLTPSASDNSRMFNSWKEENPHNENNEQLQQIKHQRTLAVLYGSVIKGDYPARCLTKYGSQLKINSQFSGDNFPSSRHNNSSIHSAEPFPFPGRISKQPNYKPSLNFGPNNENCFSQIIPPEKKSKNPSNVKLHHHLFKQKHQLETKVISANPEKLHQSTSALSTRTFKSPNLQWAPENDSKAPKKLNFEENLINNEYQSAELNPKSASPNILNGAHSPYLDDGDSIHSSTSSSSHSVKSYTNLQSNKVKRLSLSHNERRSKNRGKNGETLPTGVFFWKDSYVANWFDSKKRKQYKITFKIDEYGAQAALKLACLAREKRSLQVYYLTKLYNQLVSNSPSQMISISPPSPPGYYSQDDKTDLEKDSKHFSSKLDSPSDYSPPTSSPRSTHLSFKNFDQHTNLDYLHSPTISPIFQDPTTSSSKKENKIVKFSNGKENDTTSNKSQNIKTVQDSIIIEHEGNNFSSSKSPHQNSSNTSIYGSDEYSIRYSNSNYGPPSPLFFPLNYQNSGKLEEENTLESLITTVFPQHKQQNDYSPDTSHDSNSSIDKSSFSQLNFNTQINHQSDLGDKQGNTQLNISKLFLPINEIFDETSSHPFTPNT